MSSLLIKRNNFKGNKIQKRVLRELIGKMIRGGFTLMLVRTSRFKKTTSKIIRIGNKYIRNKYVCFLITRFMSMCIDNNK